MMIPIPIINIENNILISTLRIDKKVQFLVDCARLTRIK